MQNEVKQGHGQHQPCHEAAGNLQTQVGQAHGQQDPTARQGGQRHQ